MKDITADELRSFRDRTDERFFMLIDVREPAEYQDSHIPGAVSIPLSEFEETVEELPDKTLVIYCRTGSRSRAAALAADFFNETGKEILHLSGGMLLWEGRHVRGVPNFRILDFQGSVTDILLAAMNLEKGAYGFYSHILEQYGHLAISDALSRARDAEIAHARLIYSSLRKQQPETEDFKTVYNRLSGDILEGGGSVDEHITALAGRTDNISLDILEAGITMEYTAFDLYRVVCERFDDSALKETFVSLAQAEKEHLKLLAGALDSVYARFSNNTPE